MALTDPFCESLSLAGLQLGFGALCFSVFVLCFVLWNVTKPLDYVSVLFQFTFAATTASAPA